MLSIKEQIVDGFAQLCEAQCPGLLDALANTHGITLPTADDVMKMGEVDAKRLGKVIETLRGIRSYTQKSLADALDLSENFISLLENGHRNMSRPRMNELAALLQFTPALIYILSEKKTA